MPVYPLPADHLRVGRRTPCNLLDAHGGLLMPRGTMIESPAQRQMLLDRGVYIDEEDTDAYARALAGKVDSMVRQNESLGRIADARPDPVAAAEAPHHSRQVADPVAVFGELQLHLGQLLRQTPQADFASRLAKLQNKLFTLVEDDADTALLVLIDATASDTRHYSVTHAMLVAVVCDLAANQLQGWPAEWRDPLRSAALTMNIAMTALQDTLALQDTPPSPDQRAQIRSHAERAAQSLQAAGVHSELWIEAVLHHHDAAPGPLAELSAGSQLARLIQRADIFSALLGTRRSRGAHSGAAATKAAYLDERAQADEAGMAIIKAAGIYPPGSYVRLASGEVAVVLRRRTRANEPLVACVLTRSGAPKDPPSLRDTHDPRFAVSAGIAPHDVRLRLNLERLLELM
jgi:HD-GYP domain-containing protein (c-di-GMP phosphodiesterase class II)